VFKEAFLKHLKRDYLRTVAKALPSQVRKGLLKDNAREGLGLVGVAANTAAGALKKKRQYHGFLKAIHKGPMHADTYIGSKMDSLMQHMPIGKNLFKTKENVKLNQKLTKMVNGKKVTLEPEKYMVHERPSAMAPLSKATEIAKPVVFGLAVNKVMGDHNKRKNEQEHQ
jgi:hypothetical protein